MIGSGVGGGSNSGSGGVDEMEDMIMETCGIFLLARVMREDGSMGGDSDDGFVFDGRREEGET